MKNRLRKFWDEFNDDTKYIVLKIALSVVVFVVASMIVKSL